MAIITGTEGHDRSDLGGTDLIGTAGNDQIYGLGGNDYIEGRGGHDTLHGGGGDHNTIKGGDGDDAVLTDGRGGWFDGGSGFDHVIFGTATGGTFDLLAGSGRIGGGAAFSVLNFEHIATGGGGDVIRGTQGRNVVSSGGGHDTIEARGGNDEVFAGAGDDTVDGGARDDVLRGEAGDDTLIGGYGRDRLIGGAGHDMQRGGAGADSFVFAALGDASWGSGDVEVIEDFVQGADRIDLSAIDADAGRAGNNAFNAIIDHSNPYTYSGFRAGTIDQFDVAGGTMVLINTSDAVTNGIDKPEMAFLIEEHLNLTFADFVL